MRHGKKFNHLGRTHSHRKAMLSNMATSLILHKRITTTLAKAKSLRIYVEPLITKSKEDTTHSRRVVFSYLQSKEAVTELFKEVSIKVADRPGGYTRILRTEQRLGDNAEMCIVELVDYNELMLGGKDDKKAKTTRKRRTSGKKKEVESPVAVPKGIEAVKAEEVSEPINSIEEAQLDTDMENASDEVGDKKEE